jgi:DNA-binding response OmpR family regulator
VEYLIEWQVFFRNKIMDNKLRSRRKHVLVVEDEPNLASLMKEIAEDEGFTVSIAVNGNEAFSMIAANRELYSCVILDLKLPGMDGEKIVSHLETLGSDTKIIVYSGVMDSEIFARLSKFETVVSCHKKPVSNDIIKSILANISMRGDIKKAKIKH